MTDREERTLTHRLGGRNTHAASVEEPPEARGTLDELIERYYWRQHYMHRPYYRNGLTFADYEPAYRYGWEAAQNPSFASRGFEELESTLGGGWNEARDGTEHGWKEMRKAARDAWQRARRLQKSA